MKQISFTPYPDVNEILNLLLSEAQEFLGDQKVYCSRIRRCFSWTRPKKSYGSCHSDELRSAVLGILQDWWFPMLDDSSWLRKHGSDYHGYAGMTMCRALHALQHRTIVSKPVAIQWAKENLGSEWHALIEQVVASQSRKHAQFF